MNRDPASTVIVRGMRSGQSWLKYIESMPRIWKNMEEISKKVACTTGEEGMKEASVVSAKSRLQDS